MSEVGVHGKQIDHDKLTQVKKRADNFDASKARTWPTTADMVRMVRYIKKDCSGIMWLQLGRGPKKREVLFNVRHDPKDAEHIWIQCADWIGNGPCGWFHLKWLQERLTENGVLLKDEASAAAAVTTVTVTEKENANDPSVD